MMHSPLFPTTPIPDTLIHQLRESSAGAEAAGQLTERQRSLIQREGWFRMFVPRALGGLELLLPEGLQLQEGLARTDGSLGWTVTLCSGATMFAGYMEPDVAAGLMADPAACFGGSGAATGTATVTGNGGYEISGRWRYATGAPHLTVFTANCRIEEHGHALHDADGQPLIQSFFFLRDEVTIEDDWRTMGLKATAGHTFEVRSLHVPPSRAFAIDPAAARDEYAVLRYPFLPFAEATLAVNTAGMTLHFLDICEQIFSRRGSDNIYKKEIVSMLGAALTEAGQELAGLRNNFYDAVENSWQPMVQQGISHPDAQDAVGRFSRELVRGCRRIVTDLLPYCGMAAADPGSELNRVWRDLFTASQHTLLTYPAA